MAEETEDTTEGNPPAEGQSPSGDDKSKEEGKQQFTREDYDRLIEENKQAREESLRYRKDAEESRTYMQNVMTRLASAAERNAAQSQPPADDGELSQLLNENPRAVLDQHFQMRMGPLVEQNLMLQATHAKTLFEQSVMVDKDEDLKDDYQTYSKELEEWMKPIPLETKANPQAWRDGLDFIRAKHLKEITDRRISRQRQAASDRAAFNESPTAQPSAKGRKFVMSDDMKAIAKGLGIPEDEYAKWAQE